MKQWSNILPQLNHIATLRCDVALIIIHVSGSFCFYDIDISQGSVAMRLRCGRIFYDHFARNLLLSLSVKELLKIDQHLARLEWHFFPRRRCINQSIIQFIKQQRTKGHLQVTSMCNNYLECTEYIQRIQYI